MKKGQIYEGTVERMDFPNKGIVRVETEEGTEYASVKDALPGRRVRFVVTKRRSGKAEGRLKEVCGKAPCEAGVTACAFAGSCGGCLYQGFPYEETLKVKEGQVKRLLSAYTGDAVFEGITESPQREGYRNKMEYTFGDAVPGGPLELGLHKRGGFYDILSVPDCRIAPGDFGKILEYTLKFFRERGLAPYHRMKHTGILRHLLLRRGEGAGELLAALVSTSGISAGDDATADGMEGGTVIPVP